MHHLIEFIIEAFQIGGEKRWRNASPWMWIILASIASVVLIGLLIRLR